MGIITMQEIEYVTATDIDRKIEVRKDIGLLYEEDGEYKTLRTDFMQSFGTVENYMMTACESINLEQFSQESQDLMKNDEYNGKYVYKIVLEDGKVIPHYYTFIGFDSDTDITVVPVKIPLENIPVVSAGGRTIITSLENLSNVIKNSDIDDNKEVMMTK